MTDFAQLKAAAAQTAAVADTSDRLPRIGWRNGVKQAKTPGFFYIKAEELGADVPGEAWTEASIYDEETGYTAERLHLACIGYRSQSFLSEKAPGDKYPTTTWLTEWQPGARIFTEALVLVDGLPGLWLLSAKGLTGKALTGKGGIFQQHKKFVSTASTIISAQFSPWAFWMLVATQRDAKGGVAYTDTGFSSLVTLPAYASDVSDVASAASRLFVGKDTYAEATRLYHQHKAAGWFEARRGNAAAPVETGAVYTPTDGGPPESWVSDEDVPF